MNLFELFVKIGVDDQASGKLKDLGGKLGNGLKTAAKIGTAAVTAAAAGITALTTAAVKNYAEYEQLVGGVDTLFKKSSQKVQEYAANAYKTAGLSANEYMSTVTSFSASLLQSLGGDTEKAAKYADMAISDMSDNANKMGTDMEMIQNAYQGFAKQNYTMLDNLKLGYGGTKEEMARLIADAAKLDKSIDANDMSFGNIVKSINAVQKEMGIYGTTAKEASSTIQGSVNSMKASWQNLLTSFIGTGLSLEDEIENFVNSVSTVYDNIAPKIEIALDGAIQLIDGLFPKIIEKLPELIETLLPSIVDGALNIVQSFVTAISNNGDLLVQSAIDAVMTLANGILSMLPQIISLGLNLIVSLATGIANSLPTLIPTIIDTILLIVDTLTSPDMLSKILDAALVLITELAFGLIDAIPQLVDATFDIIDNLVVFLLDPNNIAKLLNAAVKIVIAIGTGLINAIPRLLGSAVVLIKKLIQNFKDTDWGEVGKNIVDGLLNGLKRAWESLKKWVSDAWDSLVGGIKDFLGIHSPSRVFAGIGKNMALGVGEGWDDAFSDVQDDINSSMDFGESDYGITTSATSISDFGGGSSAYGYGGSQNVNVTVGIDDSANAMGLARALLPFLKIAEKEVYA